jgi:hypothetical protein
VQRRNADDQLRAKSPTSEEIETTFEGSARSRTLHRGDLSVDWISGLAKDGKTRFPDRSTMKKSPASSPVLPFNQLLISIVASKTMAQEPE